MADPSITEILTALVERRELSPEQVERAFAPLLAGQFHEGEAAAFLVALRMKGETAGELAAAATLLRARMQRFDTGRDDVLDTCGTGGDGAGTFNISTAAALVAAAAGVPVVKHGNRAVSSRTGSADVLAELGVPVEAGPDWAKRCLDRAGLAFCFAPHFHPAMKHVGPLRRRLGVRTLLNLLGPLANPAGAAYQLLGVGRPELLDPLAGALARLGVRQAFVVCGRDGLDEVSLSAPTLYRRVRNGSVIAGEWTVADFGLEPCSPDDLKADGAAASAQLIRRIVSNEDLPAARVVIANAAAALVVAERAKGLRDGAAAAAAAIRSGRAAEVLSLLQRTTDH
ncbi:MAG: anthranilate phosphoribosyltransferase [Gemmataceae bacterium]